MLMRLRRLAQLRAVAVGGVLVAAAARAASPGDAAVAPTPTASVTIRTDLSGLEAAA